jgi:small GTP-binding protein
MTSRRVSFNHDNARKVILLGNTGVGKTSLTARWVHGAFDARMSPTIGAASWSKDVQLGQAVVKITLWDTAGQEQFRSIAPLYIRGARVAVIVASADSAETLHAIPAWLELLAQADEEPVPALLAINKCDCRDPWADDALCRAIELYRASFVTVFAVSAMSGDQVAELFTEAARLADAADRPGVEPAGPAPARDGGAAKCC